MNVDEICQHRVLTVSRTADVNRAAQLMRQEHVGYLVVVDPGDAGRRRPVGVLTDRDIVVAVVARKRKSESVTVEEVMTQPPVTIRATDSLEKALHEMRRVGIHRLPVVDQHGMLAGLVSRDDVLRFVASELRSVVESAGDYSDEPAGAARTGP